MHRMARRSRVARDASFPNRLLCVSWCGFESRQAHFFSPLFRPRASFCAMLFFRPMKDFFGITSVRRRPGQALCLFLLAACSALCACTSLSPPQGFEAPSPASPNTPEKPAPPINAALQSDPPMPSAPAGAHEHHHHHHAPSSPMRNTP